MCSYSIQEVICAKRELRYERDMLGAIQARPEVVLRQRGEDAKPGQGLENAMQGLVLSQVTVWQEFMFQTLNKDLF